MGQCILTGAEQLSKLLQEMEALFARKEKEK